MKITFKFTLALLIVAGISGCTVFQPNVMLRTKKNFQYDIPPDSANYQYRLAPNDYLQFRLFSNEGFKAIDISAQNQTFLATQNQGFSYLIEYDGAVKLPMLRRIPLAGITMREAELILEEKYAEFYKKPFVMLSINNRRVIMFPGSGGSAQVINLLNENTTLFEALAMAGGISSSGKAKKIKLIRGDLQNPEVYLIDLSTIDGMKQADLILQANDIIYVQPQFRIASEVLQEITPVLTLLTTALSMYAIIISLQPRE
ncbi:MAG: hypothetical protein COA57_06775 [Flavobacteriales bacterium]|nr:MAG: hypothetical protein COA57_06775 [Flavobacteriales bacterium]